MAENSEAETPAAEDRASGFASPQKGARLTTRLWLKVGGWMVTGIGFLTIISALRSLYAHHWPFLVVAGLVLMGASYSLAGMALSESRSWPIPLVILACVTYCVFPPYGFGVLLGAGLSVICICAATEEAFEHGIGQNAQLAFGLWLGGLAVILFYWAMAG